MAIFILTAYSTFQILLFYLQILDGSNILTVNENTSTPFYIISKTSQVEIVIPSKYNDATEDELKIVYKSKCFANTIKSLSYNIFHCICVKNQIEGGANEAKLSFYLMLKISIEILSELVGQGKVKIGKNG